jgi:Tannase and feruloyl esterase
VGLKFRDCWLLVALLGVAGGCSGTSIQDATRCASLKGLRLEQTQIVAADYHSAGHDLSWRTLLIGIPWIQVPASCRVKLVLTPSTDSHIESEVWMPTTEWNGRLWSVGNGGLAGSVDEISMRLALSRGYATAGTDTGHSGSDKEGVWALNHPEKLIDFGSRAIHVTAVAAKALLKGLHGKLPAFSYFASGSNGGREALNEAQKYPDDYDGIEAGAPAFDGSNNIVSGSFMEQQLVSTKRSWIPKSKLKAIQAASLAACDEVDGLKDGLIDDPRRCKINPDALVCRGADTDACLTPEQVVSLKTLYNGPGGEDPAQFRYYGFEPGGEVNWGEWSLSSGPRKSVLYGYALEFHRYIIKSDPRWALDDFEFSRDNIDADARMGPDYDARDADLSRFAARGGKLVLYHGWSDQALQPRLTIDYYLRVQALAGEAAAANFVVLYMVPGMAHVFAGDGPNAFGQAIAPAVSASKTGNIGSTLIAWVERGEPPGPVVAGKYKNDFRALLAPEGMVAVRTRPLCRFPEVARWSGQGSIDDARNFSCSPPPADTGA